MIAGLNALSFTSPWILIALASLPVIWLLLRATPPAPSRVKFPAFVILRQLTTPKETPDKTPWWLLLLRLLIATFIILALAGPVLNAPKPNPGAGPLVLIVDDTWPAAYRWQLRLNAMETAISEAESGQRPVVILKTAPRLLPTEPAIQTADEARETIAALRPQPFLANRLEAIAHLESMNESLRRLEGNREIYWLSDGLQNDADAQFVGALKTYGDLTVFKENVSSPIILTQADTENASLRYQVERLTREGAWTGELVATARDGRELARQNILLAEGENITEVSLDLPLALRNEVSVVRINSVASVGAIHLTDARNRTALIGLIESPGGRRDQLLNGNYYIQQALQPYSAFLYDRLENLVESDVSVIMLDDIGRLRTSDVDALTDWIERGGVVVRFAGPTLAEASQDQTPPLIPVPLHGGGRAFGGALSWETPQPLGAFNDAGPFADLAVPDDVLIRRQVLARPGGETTLATWASLEDGTPLVTGLRQGEGALVLFHVTATPAWSDLSLSSIFVDMLRKLTHLSILSPENVETDETVRFAPLRTLDGFGRFAAPSPSLTSVTAADADNMATPKQPPGFYGSADAPIAINAIATDETFAPLTVSNTTAQSYSATPPQRLATPLFIIAVLLFVADSIAALWIAGRLKFAAPAIIAAALLFPTEDVTAQPLDPQIDEKATSAAISTRLAYVRTGDRFTDQLSERGLTALTNELIRRTAIEPAAPVGVDLETDDLSVYPFLYWPISSAAPIPSDVALSNIENFMRFGGLILFDTRDDEQAIAGLETPQRVALRNILTQLDIPPLTTLPKDHVLTRSFYLLGDLPGRMANNPIWVQATGNANDSVTPLIIGGRDWAGIWAVDDFGRPLVPLGRSRITENCTGSVRECAYRAGINIIMVAFTGNYKSDQVHTPILLDRLGRER